MPFIGSQPPQAALTSASISDGAITTAKFATGSVDAAAIATNAVDSAEIATGAVDLAHLSATGTAGSGNFLRGDNAWQAAGGGKLLQIVAAQLTSSTTVALGAGPGSYPWWTTGLTCAITPTASGNKIHAIFTGAIGGTADSNGLGNTACAIGLAGHDSGSGFASGTDVSNASDAFSLIWPHTYNLLDHGEASGAWYWNVSLHGLHVTTGTSALTYEVYIAPVYGVSAAATFGNAAGSTSSGPGNLILMEIEA